MGTADSFALKLCQCWERRSLKRRDCPETSTVHAYSKSVTCSPCTWEFVLNFSKASFMEAFVTVGAPPCGQEVRMAVLSTFKIWKTSGRKDSDMRNFCSSAWCARSSADFVAV